MRLRAPAFAMIAALALAGCHGGEPEYAPSASSFSVVIDYGYVLSSRVTGYDADGDALSFELVDAPAYGYLTFYPDSGSFIYTPLAGFSGTDAFTFRAFDGWEWSDLGAVTITVRQPPIVIVNG
jgi:hypothetical protein